MVCSLISLWKCFVLYFWLWPEPKIRNLCTCYLTAPAKSNNISMCANLTVDQSLHIGVTNTLNLKWNPRNFKRFGFVALSVIDLNQCVKFFCDLHVEELLILCFSDYFFVLFSLWLTLAVTRPNGKTVVFELNKFLRIGSASGSPTSAFPNIEGSRSRWEGRIQVVPVNTNVDMHLH